MNRPVAFIMLIFSIQPVVGTAQEWAPIGAKWHFNYTGTSYSVFESTGDTIILGKTCRKIEKSKDYHYWGNRPLMEFTFYSNDSVYFYDQNFPGFYLLYDFNASPGDSWYYQFPGESHTGDIDSIKVIVDSVDMVTINSYSLKRLYIHYDTVNFEWTDDCFLLCDKQSSIIQYLGDTLNMFNTFTMDEVELDAEFPGVLRCYDDPIIGHYETGIVDSCTWVNTLDIQASSTKAVEIVGYFDLLGRPMSKPTGLTIVVYSDGRQKLNYISEFE